MGSYPAANSVRACLYYGTLCVGIALGTINMLEYSNILSSNVDKLEMYWLSFK